MEVTTFFHQETFVSGTGEVRYCNALPLSYSRNIKLGRGLLLAKSSLSFLSPAGRDLDGLSTFTLSLELSPQRLSTTFGFLGVVSHQLRAVSVMPDKTKNPVHFRERGVQNHF